MIITVHVKAKSSQTKLEVLSEKELRLWTREAPIEGRANEAIRKQLAMYFDMSPSSVVLLRGEKSKTKIVKIPTSCEFRLGVMEVQAIYLPI